MIGDKKHIFGIFWQLFRHFFLAIISAFFWTFFGIFWQFFGIFWNFLAIFRHFFGNFLGFFWEFFWIFWRNLLQSLGTHTLPKLCSQTPASSAQYERIRKRYTVWPASSAATGSAPAPVPRPMAPFLHLAFDLDYCLVAASVLHRETDEEEDLPRSHPPPLFSHGNHPLGSL